ncbi:MAG: von Willebrand factor type A domain-containing protein, partial [Victivallales bacterium]|nr:von Willebrand factor type A domain-containing protein [Victivallales bacterium]
MTSKKDGEKLKVRRETRESAECAHNISLMVDLLADEITEENRSKLADQLDACEICRAKLDELSRVWNLTRDVLNESVPKESSAAEPGAVPSSLEKSKTTTRNSETGDSDKSAAADSAKLAEKFPKTTKNIKFVWLEIAASLLFLLFVFEALSFCTATSHKDACTLSCTNSLPKLNNVCLKTAVANQSDDEDFDMGDDACDSESGDDSGSDTVSADSNSRQEGRRNLARARKSAASVNGKWNKKIPAARPPSRAKRSDKNAMMKMDNSPSISGKKFVKRRMKRNQALGRVSRESLAKRQSQRRQATVTRRNGFAGGVGANKEEGAAAKETSGLVLSIVGGCPNAEPGSGSAANEDSPAVFADSEPVDAVEEEAALEIKAEASRMPTKRPAIYKKTKRVSASSLKSNAKPRSTHRRSLKKGMTAFGTGYGSEKKKISRRAPTTNLKVHVSKKLYRMMGGSDRELFAYLRNRGIRLTNPKLVSYDAGTAVLTVRGVDAGTARRVKQMLYTLEADLERREKMGKGLPFIKTRLKPFSTFSIDVDTASYERAAKIIMAGGRPSPDSVRPEEFVNYFDYHYHSAAPGETFGMNLEAAPSLFRPANILFRIGVLAKRLGAAEAKRPSAFTILIDASGSMAGSNRLELVKYIIPLLLPKTKAVDRVAVVVCGA